MNNYLFRGKGKNGEWHKGDLMQTKKATYIVWHDYETHEELPENPKEYYSGWDEVVVETIGQYSGVYDIVGNKIFEGDIVQGEAKCTLNQITIENPLTVTFDEGAFWVTGRTKYNRIGYCLLCNVVNLKVVGNIHDEEK